MTRRFVWWRFVVYGTILDALLCAAVAYLVSNEGDRLAVFFVAFLALQIVPLGLLLWGTIRYWITAKGVVLPALSNDLFKEMKSTGFPSPELWEDAPTYLGRVMEDELQPYPVRLKAASWAGSLGTAKELRSMTQGLMLMLALEDAMKRYAHSLP